MAGLPEDSELLRLYALGLKNPEIAAQYGVTPQAVNYRFDKLKIKRRPITTQANALIGQVWTIGAEPGTEYHQNLSAISYLRVWVRQRLGDDSLSAAQRKKASNFIKRVVDEDVVLKYEPWAENPFTYVPRQPSDGRLVVRWPSDQPRPEGGALRALELPREEEPGSPDSLREASLPVVV